MKYFQPRSMKPHTNQFFAAVKDKISEEGQTSFAYKAVYGLFEQAESFYRNLDFVTRSINLKQQQEHNAVALTVMYVRDLRIQLIHDLVKEDPKINDVERQVLEMTLEIYKTVCEANYSVLGNPKWTDD